MLLYADHTAVVSALAFAPDGSTLACGSRDGSVFLRDAIGKRQLLPGVGPCGLPIQAIVFTPDGSTVLIGGGFGWLGMQGDFVSGKIFLPHKHPPVTSLAMLDDHTLAVGTGDRAKTGAGKFELWDVPTCQRRSPCFIEPNGVRAVATCPAKRMVAWATGHRKICVWEVVKASPIEFPQPKPCHAVALAPDGTQFAAAVDYAVKVYSVGGRRERLELKGHKGQVSAVTFSPDGVTLATGSWDGTVKIWDAATGRERETFRWPVGRVYSLAFAPDGLRLAAGGDTGGVVIWDME